MSTASMAAMKAGQRVLEIGVEEVRESMFSRWRRAEEMRVWEGMGAVDEGAVEEGDGGWEGRV